MTKSANTTSTGRWSNTNKTFNCRDGWLQTVLEWGKLLGNTLDLTEEEKERWLYD